MDQRIERATQAVVETRYGCGLRNAPPPLPGPGESDAVTAPPPTAEEVWASVPLPLPGFEMNPTQGLTGLETLLWTAEPGAVDLILPPVRGYVITAQARPTQYRWVMGDGDIEVSPSAGTGPDNPSARHMYDTKGDFTVTLEIVWTGSFTAEGNGAPPQTTSLGSTSRQSAVPYHVIEVRTVLDQPAPAGQ
jgi:hypothetical protein